MSLKAALETLGSGPCYHMIEIFEHPEHAGFWQAAWRGEPQQIEALPRWDRNPNTGEEPDSVRPEAARQRIFHDPERPSHVTLTVVDR